MILHLVDKFNDTIRYNTVMHGTVQYNTVRTVRKKKHGTSDRSSDRTSDRYCDRDIFCGVKSTQTKPQTNIIVSHFRINIIRMTGAR